MGICGSKKDKKKGKRHKSNNEFRPPEGRDKDQHKGPKNRSKRNTGQKHHVDGGEVQHKVEHHHKKEEAHKEECKPSGGERKPQHKPQQQQHRQEPRKDEDHGWHRLRNEKKFGKNHEYFHEKVHVMKAMKNVHLDDAKRAHHYFETCSQNIYQQTHFDMEQGMNDKDLNVFNAILHKHHFKDLRLSFYENKHLNEKTFHHFMDGVQKSEHLEKLDVNLRWCDQVTDKWLERLGKTPNTLRHFELWVWNCKHVTDHGLEMLLKGLYECERLETLKIYMGETSMTSSSRHILENFQKQTNVPNLRVCGDHVDFSSERKEKKKIMREEITSSYIQEMNVGLVEH